MNEDKTAMRHPLWPQMIKEHKQSGVLIRFRVDAKQDRQLFILPEMAIPSNLPPKDLVSYRPLTSHQRRAIRKKYKITLSDRLRRAAAHARRQHKMQKAAEGA